MTFNILVIGGEGYPEQRIFREVVRKFPSTNTNGIKVWTKVVPVSMRNFTPENKTTIRQWDLALSSIHFDAAIFYNISGLFGLRGMTGLAKVCEDFVKKNPGCVTNYHHSEKQFLPTTLDLLSSSWERSVHKVTNLHLHPSYSPEKVVADLKKEYEAFANSAIAQHYKL